MDIFNKCKDFTRAKEIFSGMLGFQKEDAIYLLSSENVIMIISLSLIILMFQYYFANKRIIDVFTKFKHRKTIYILAVSILIFFIITFKGEGGAFIYFQF